MTNLAGQVLLGGPRAHLNQPSPSPALFAFMTTLRPILKTRPASNLNDYFPSPSNALPFKLLTSPHVHFPPSSTLTDIQMTHSPFVYDRAPIVVLPNACKLPERGGRDYSAYGIMRAPRRKSAQGSDFDLRPHHSHHHDEEEDENPPPLVHDHSSESEDSDACISSPAHADEYDTIPSKSDNHTPYDIGPMSSPRTLAFFSHPHDSEHQKRPLRRPKLKRKQTGLGPRAAAFMAGKNTFAGADGELSLDGCLGGF
ncbi:hypothetical protein C0993_001629 [Termitomyces sp. T159_Od127]|nr:hypothetical protein C0993_001629 [Termitomyces sp. T159_Od127]